MALVVSGAIFTHKEVTSTGEIVVHNHPYDFTKKGEKHHHSDDEIHFLDVVFCHVFTPTSFFAYEPIVRTSFAITHARIYDSEAITLSVESTFLRGPPLV